MQIECPSCEGGGMELDADGEQTAYGCERCDGTGEVDVDELREDAIAERAIDAWRDERAADMFR